MSRCKCWTCAIARDERTDHAASRGLARLHARQSSDVDADCEAGMDRAAAVLGAEFSPRSYVDAYWDEAIAMDCPIFAGMEVR